MIDSSGNLVVSTMVESDALKVFSRSISELAVEDYSLFEIDRLFGDRAGVGDPLSMLAVGLDIYGKPELICAMPIELRGREAVLGSYFPRSTDISVARFTVLKALEYLAGSSGAISVFARAPEGIRVPYEVNGFAKSTGADRLYLCSSKLRSHAS